jgi:hypothetical protein
MIGRKGPVNFWACLKSKNNHGGNMKKQFWGLIFASCIGLNSGAATNTVVIDCLTVIVTQVPGSGAFEDVFGKKFSMIYSGAKGEVPWTSVSDDFFTYMITLNNHMETTGESSIDMYIRTINIPDKKLVSRAEASAAITRNEPAAKLFLYSPQDATRMIDGSYVHGVQLYCLGKR